MNDIRIYDFSFRLLYIVHNVKSAYWSLSYNDIGTFEGVFLKDDKLIDVLFSNDHLILAQGNLKAIVTGKRLEKTVTIYGRTPNWILTRRVVKPFSATLLKQSGAISDTSLQSVSGYLLGETFSDVPEFSVTVPDDIDASAFEKENIGTFFDAIKDGISPLGLGHEVRLLIPEKKWELRIFKGRERAKILSHENRNFKDVTLSEDMQNAFTSGFYKKELQNLGKWNPNKDTFPTPEKQKYGSYYTVSYEKDAAQNAAYPDGAYIVSADEKTGAFSVYSELPVLYSYLAGEKTGIYRFDTVLSTASEQEAKNALFLCNKQGKVSGDAVGIAYGKDYELGDTFRVRVNVGTKTRAVKKMVDGVDLFTESGQTGETIRFKEEEHGI